MRYPEQRKNKINGAECESTNSRRPRPLNGHASKDLDRRRKVDENLAVRNLTECPDLLPGIKVMPGESNDAKSDSSHSIYVSSEIDSRHLNPHCQSSSRTSRSNAMTTRECFPIATPKGLQFNAYVLVARRISEKCATERT